MAVVTSTVITKGAGSIGNITVRSRKGGGLIVSGKATIVSNPKTEAQTFQRTRFNNVNLILRALLIYLNSYWIRSKANVAPIAEASSKALRTIATDISNIIDIASSRIQVAKGALSQFVNLEFSDIEYNETSKQLSFLAEWSSQLFGNASVSDEIFFVLVNCTKGQVEGVSANTLRSAQSINEGFTITYPDDVYQIAFFTKNTTGSIFGDGYSCVHMSNQTPALCI